MLIIVVLTRAAWFDYMRRPRVDINEYYPYVIVIQYARAINSEAAIGVRWSVKKRGVCALRARVLRR